MKSIQQVYEELIQEAVSLKDFERAFQLMKSYFAKSDIKCMNIPYSARTQNDGTRMCHLIFSTKTYKGALVFWENQMAGTEIFKVSFINNIHNALYAITYDESWSTDIDVYVDGASLSSMFPFIKDVLQGTIAMQSSAIDKYAESHRMYESLVEESEDVTKEINKLKRQISKMQKNGEDTTKEEDLLAELNFKAAKKALEVRKGGVVTMEPDPEVNSLDQIFKDKRPTPEERFSDMENYINMVLRGLQPSVVICGAPGVGKSYRISQKIESKGYKMFDNYFLVKGKCTPLALYQTLFEYSREGDVICIDDADDIIKNELSVNLLKAACDSSEHRYVNYGTSKLQPAAPGATEDKPYLAWEQDEKGRVCYPKSFEFKGKIIIITNMQAGQLDTALRNRSLLCDLCFTVEECLEIIEGLLPKLGAGLLSNQSKQDALSYLKKLAEKKADMEVSLRSFNTLARIYEACEGDSKSAQRMIDEQMALQFARGGKRY